MAVVIKGFVELGGTDYSAHFQGLKIKTTRDTVEASTFAHLFDQYEKGTYQGDIELMFIAKPGSALETFWITEYKSSGNTAFKWRDNANAAAGATNPEWSGVMLISELPPIGGARKDLSGKASMTVKLNGPITRDLDDGSPVVIGS